MMEKLIEILTSGLAELGLQEQTAPGAADGLGRYCTLLLEQNKVMNLTAITGPEDAARLHMLDSAALLTCPGVTFEGKLLDVGSGAGLPGLALKLLRPELDVTLLDSQEKRVDWLARAAAELGLTGTACLHRRAEEAGHKAELREGFDLVTARAVAELRVLCELCLPFVRLGGRMLAMKGPDPEEEVKSAAWAIEELGGQLSEIWTYTIPQTGVVHSVVAVEKLSHTPNRYPRRWSRIKSTPLTPSF